MQALMYMQCSPYQAVIAVKFTSWTACNRLKVLYAVNMISFQSYHVPEKFNFHTRNGCFFNMGAYYERKTFKTEQNKLESNVLICYLKITTAFTIGPKMKKWCLQNLALTHPSPQESAPLAHIFSLPARNGPLPAEVKFGRTCDMFESFLQFQTPYHIRPPISGPPFQAFPYQTTLPPLPQF